MAWIALVILLLLFGGILLSVEVFVLPGFGVVGTLGLLVITVAGLVVWTQLALLPGVIAVSGGILANGLAFWLLPRTAAGRALTLEAHHPALALPPMDRGDLVGQQGLATTPLRPVGRAEIRGRALDVVTEGTYVAAGTPVRVVRAEWARLVVEPIEETIEKK